MLRPGTRGWRRLARGSLRLLLLWLLGLVPAQLLLEVGGAVGLRKYKQASELLQGGANTQARVGARGTRHLEHKGYHVIPMFDTTQLTVCDTQDNRQNRKRRRPNTALATVNTENDLNDPSSHSSLGCTRHRACTIPAIPGGLRDSFHDSWS